MFQLLWTAWHIARKVLICTVSDSMMLVLPSLAVPSLTLVCVCVCSCVGVSISYDGVMKGRAMVDNYSTFISGSVRVLLCNEAPGTSSSLAVEGEAVEMGF